MLTSFRNGNLLLAFLLELAMLAAFCFAGWVSTNVLWLRILLAVGFPGLAIVLWAMWAAPKAGKRRLKPRPLLLFKFAMFGLATAAWWVAGQNFIGSIFGALAVIHLSAAAMFRQV